MKVTPALKQELANWLDTYWNTYLKGDIETWATFIRHDYRNIGGTKEEIWNSKQEIIDYTNSIMDQMLGSVEIRNREIEVIPYGEYLMVNEFTDLYVKIDGEWTLYGPFRMSSLLERTDTGWIALHQHGSYPDMKATEGEAFSIDAVKVENLKLLEAVKNRTIELENKNRELEIETTLEKVRSSALAMNEPADMVQVCKVISDQLQLLGVTDIRNVQTAIINEQKGTYLNYQYFAAYNEGVIEETDYNLHPTSFAMAQEMKKSAHSTFSGSLDGLELNTFREWRKQYNQFPDPLLDEVDSIHYYFYSIGQGGLGLSTYKSLSEEGLEIFKRFHNVFTLAYRRFTDIKLALAQAREAQIEAAVERVRAQSMAMYQTADLHKVNEEVLNQLYKLKVDGLTGVSIYLVDEYDTVTIWDLSSPGNMSIPNSYSIKYDAKKYPVMGEWVEIWKTTHEDYFVLDAPKEKLIKAVEEFKEIHPEMGIKFKNAIESGSLNHQWNPVGRLSDGVLSIDLINPPSEDTKTIVIKMAGAFNMAYQRFLDLQKAEAQAREARIEAALERIRSRALIMHNSTEVGDVSDLLFYELEKMDINPKGFSIMVFDREKDKYELWRAKEVAHQGVYETLSIKAMYDKLDQHIPGFTAQLETSWDSGYPFFIAELSGSRRISFIEANREMGNYTEDQFENVLRIYPDPIFWHLIFFKHGWLGLIQNEQLPADILQVIHRFADVFEFAHTRFLDLQKAEAHAVRAEKDLIAIKVARQNAEEALSVLKATQAQLIQSEKMASLGELTAGIAHEIQNPLNFVNNFSEVNVELIAEMKEELEAGNLEDIKAIADDIAINEEKILQHGKRADAIVKGMLQHSRSSNGVKELTDINALADEYLRLSYHGLRAKDKSFNADFNNEFDESLPEINIIPQDIGRVLLNLINNAFYAVAEKQRSMTELDNYEPTVTISTKNLSENIEISVKDNGNGIPEEIKKKIFQPFFTTKPTGQGTGLGLSLAYDIIKAHGGELKLETREGEGSEFIIRLMSL
ncbi:MAG: integral membrane sensor signal transduction histidine kinase [Bacteroidetes bacterium]|nr:MAG: integral membrane sensor signal transduction histidine kinase [Bacteroidota bacterium]